MSAQFNGGLIGDAKKLTGAVWAIRRCGCVEGDSLEELFVYFDSELEASPKVVKTSEASSER